MVLGEVCGGLGCFAAVCGNSMVPEKCILCTAEIFTQKFS